MLYRHATLKEARKIMEILIDFTSASRTEINKENSDIYFFNTPTPSQSFLEKSMGFRIGNFPTKYLGIQLNDQQNRVANWKTLMGKIQWKMQNWTFKMLNIQSRIILLKSVLQSILIYQLTSQATPKTVCQKMVDMFKKFLWQGPSMATKWALLSWSWLNKSLKEGGLGLRDPYILN